jgi:hypothetical protein
MGYAAGLRVAVPGPLAWRCPVKCAILILGLLAAATSAAAQVVSGTLLEDQSRAPLTGGLVTLISDATTPIGQARTDSTGAFHFVLPRAGTYRLRAQLLGYAPALSPDIDLGSVDTVFVEFSLARDVVLLDPLVVTARSRHLTPAARSFYDRAARIPFGDFITYEEIQKSHVHRTTELLRSIGGMRLTPVAGGNEVTVRGDCRPTVYVDGVRVDGYRTIDDLAQPLELEGLEVYKSAVGAPAQYSGLRAGCAIILVWTRIE